MYIKFVYQTNLHCLWHLSDPDIAQLSESSGSALPTLAGLAPPIY